MKFKIKVYDYEYQGDDYQEIFNQRVWSIFEIKEFIENEMESILLDMQSKSEYNGEITMPVACIFNETQCFISSDEINMKGWAILCSELGEQLIQIPFEFIAK